VEFALLPFGADSLTPFLYLERPAGSHHRRDDRRTARRHLPQDLRPAQDKLVTDPAS
jgi:hypothetical protein